MEAVLYIHGKGGSGEEAGHYQPLFPSHVVIGLDYKGSTPWEAGGEIKKAVQDLRASYDGVILIANSIGAYFAMSADLENEVKHAYFISPIVDMEKLIADRMAWAGVTEAELRERGSIPTAFGDALSWEYLCYARERPVTWNAPTDILYGSADPLTSMDTITAFAQKHHAGLTVLEQGEHWFHTEAQMRFLDAWIREKNG